MHKIVPPNMRDHMNKLAPPDRIVNTPPGKNISRFSCRAELRVGGEYTAAAGPPDEFLSLLSDELVRDGGDRGVWE